VEWDRGSSSNESPVGVFRGPEGDDDGSGQGTLHAMFIRRTFLNHIERCNAVVDDYADLVAGTVLTREHCPHTDSQSG